VLSDGIVSLLFLGPAGSPVAPPSHQL